MVLHPPEVFLRRIEKRSKHPNIDKILAFAAGKSYNDYMCNIGISGDPGMGKSTLAIIMGLRADRDFRFDTHMAYSRREIIEKGYSLEKHSFMVSDEAIGAFKRRAMEAEQKDLVEMINKIRFKNHVIVWNLPFFTDLDAAVRKHFDIWIHVVDRGKALVLMRNLNILAQDPWMPGWWVRKWAWKAIQSKEALIKMLREHPLYTMTLRFPDLPSYLKQIYRYYSEKAKKRLESEEKGQKPFMKKLKTTTGKMVEMYVLSTIVLGYLLRRRVITVEDVKTALFDAPPRKEIKEILAGLLHKVDYWPVDVMDFVKQIYSKFDAYRDT